MKFKNTSLSLLREPLPVPEYQDIIKMSDISAKSKNDLEALRLQPLSLAHIVVPGPPKPPYHGIPLHIPFWRPYKLPKLLEINPKTKAPVVLNRVHGWLKITGWQQQIAHDMRDHCIATKTFHKRKFRREFRFKVRAEQRARRKDVTWDTTKAKDPFENDEVYQQVLEYENVGEEYLSKLPVIEEEKVKKGKKQKVKKVKKKVKDAGEEDE